MRPLPTTLEYVATWAAREPRRPALRERDSRLDYGQLDALLLRCAHELQRLGVVRGQRIAVSGPDFAVQVVLLLAAEALGAVTLSFQVEDDPDEEFIFGHVDWVFATRPLAVPEGVRFQLVDAGFARRLAEPAAGPAPAWAPPALHEPQRIVRTAGSSGASKFMVLTRGAQEWAIQAVDDSTHLDRDSRALVLAPLVINAALARTCACLRVGGQVMVGHGRDIAALDPTHIHGLPAHLERLLREMPAGHVAPRIVEVATFGGTPTPALAARCEAAFGSRPVNRYGSNESGPICHAIDDSGAGVLFAGVDVRILDERGQELPPGRAGIIAVRTPGMVDGYLERPGASAAAFRGGWFHSGDVGVLVAPRRLRLLGRHDDLVNIGGIKVPASKLEASACAQPAIAECAVLAVHLEGGSVTLGAALVAAPGATAAQATSQFRAAMKFGPETSAQVLVVSHLPRTIAGKVDRIALLQLLQP